jgi:type VI secretion system secreted protein Hcp
MAVDMFLKLDIAGESRDDKHAGEIDIASWSWGMTQSASTHMGSGGGSGKVAVNDVQITKFVDKATPNLHLACCTGKHYPQVLLTIRKAGDKPVEYYKLTMEEVLISSIQIGGHGGDDRLTESVTLNFAKFKEEYTPQKADGTGDAAVEGSFDIAKNVKV